ncbi:hypothetical protein ADIS_0035 [Lunatimonas lonarensis]|uniref:Uncharacterized protein n=1 Tax=Lunatimonas lonarensis TaxID=1232681 RepID=R7ZZJ1_9BACT|nr:hypothetical protein ADIS_0035 [Lunatimonas lonarensis]
MKIVVQMHLLIAKTTKRIDKQQPRKWIPYKVPTNAFK